MRSVFTATIGTALLAAACNTSEVPSGALSSNAADTAITTEPVSVSEPVAAQTLTEPVRTKSEPAQTRATQRTPVPTPSATRESATLESTPAVRVPEYREVDLPAGTPLALALATPVASDRSQVEERVRATLREPVIVDGEAVLPAGTEIMGRVTDVERSGRVKGRARLAMRFTLIRHEGDEYDVRSEAIERVAAATKGEDATRVGIGAGAGAAIGAVLGGGSGAAKGAAIGAAAGTGTVLATRGEEVRLEAGEALDTRLTSPLPVRLRIR